MTPAYLLWVTHGSHKTCFGWKKCTAQIHRTASIKPCTSHARGWFNIPALKHVRTSSRPCSTGGVALISLKKKKKVSKGNFIYHIFKFCFPFLNIRFLKTVQIHIYLSYLFIQVKFIAEYPYIPYIWKLTKKQKQLFFFYLLLNISWVWLIHYSIEISGHFGEMLILRKAQSTSHIHKGPI